MWFLARIVLSHKFLAHAVTRHIKKSPNQKNNENNSCYINGPRGWRCALTCSIFSGTLQTRITSGQLTANLLPSRPQLQVSQVYQMPLPFMTRTLNRRTFSWGSRSKGRKLCGFFLYWLTWRHLDMFVYDLHLCTEHCGPSGMEVNPFETLTLAQLMLSITASTPSYV